MMTGATGGLAAKREVWQHEKTDRLLGDERAGVALKPLGVPSLDAEERWAESEATGSWLALSGRPFPVAGDPMARPGAATRVLRVLDERGPEA